MESREIALKVLSKADTDVSYYDQALKKYLDDSQLSLPDRALAHELTAGVLRHRMWLDWVLDQSLTKGMKSLTPWEQNILRLGLYQIAKLDRIPPFAAVNESVNLSKRYGRKSTIGLTNAVLRDIIRHQRHLKPIRSGDKTRDLSIEYSHPLWLVKRWLKELGEEETKSLLQANNRQARVIIRPNRLKTGVLELQEKLRSSGFKASANKYISTALEVENPAVLADDPLFGQGYFYFQDPSGQAVSLLAQAGPGNAVLDLCAAPGGKASAALERMKDSGLLLAVDLSEQKLSLIKENFTRLGLKSYSLICADAANFVSRKKFDLVLIDAPCSGLGALRRRLDIRWRIKEQDIVRLARLQFNILNNAAGLVKPGGAMVYSTCTLTPEENRGTIKKFLAKNPEFILDDAGQFISQELVKDGFFSSWPHLHGMDGAFAARLLKAKS
ncbi:16S rRNA (cytosine(967)-C(5))-methyltransferase RsmB [candidate division TA06 bacterium]|uniref:16S rRNA (cytosine(967)-C(5))-methyltransferase n=1 Tax=candidate division TA06 bacterium TaxID=2250710 RepID=A0A933IB29_UNCT6|nr:16S rRNA (cytosine(967)-C(5))-methyltransferase RsmB [candidate division TA06 bacterium]